MEILHSVDRMLHDSLIRSKCSKQGSCEQKGGVVIVEPVKCVMFDHNGVTQYREFVNTFEGNLRITI